MAVTLSLCSLFFFNDTATTEIYTLSLHDALPISTLTPTSDSLINVEVWMPISGWNLRFEGTGNGGYAGNIALDVPEMIDRKSTRLNSSHRTISYAVFCLKKKKKKKNKK